MRQQQQRFHFPRPNPWKVFVRTSLACAILGAAIFAVSLKRIDRLPLDGSPLGFDAKESFEYMTRLSKDYPNRFTWSQSRHRAGDWIKSQFQKMGYIPHSLLFSEVIGGKQYMDLEDIYAEKRGTHTPDEIILMVGHYDVTDTTVEGAMDDASGVAIMMELARVFSKENPNRTLIFMATDSEEFGAFWGARAFAQNFDRAGKIVAVANFDFVAPGKQTGILTLCDGLKQGYTPLWLRELALDSIRETSGVTAIDMVNIVEHVQRALQIPAADHGAFLAAEIPAFNWVGETDNFAYEMSHFHHTEYDRVEAMEPTSLETYGKAAERLVRSVDNLYRVPPNFRDHSYWKISPHLYLEGWTVTILHILAFIPFLLYSLAKFGWVLQNQSRERVRRAFRNEAKNIVILFGSLLLGYALLLLLPALHVITQYETFPATQKSLLLYTPDFVAILMVVGSIAVAYAILKKTFSEPDDQADFAEIRQAVHAAILTLIITLAFFKNSYLATLLLLPPAYFWTAMKAKKRKASRILNGLLLLGGAITLITIAIVMGTIFHVGVVYWYLFLAAAYGLISAYSVVLFFLALTVMIRLFRSFILVNR